MRNHVCLLLAAAVGCSNAGPGTSVGRPPATPVVHLQPSPLRVAEVYVADADTAEHFVELVVDEDETVDLSSVELCGPAGCIAEPACSATAVSSGARVTCELGDLDLPGSAGELAVVDGDIVLAYLAWGAEPSVFDTPWSALAVATGASEAGAFVPVTFPMPLGVAVMTAADGSSGCAAPSRGSEGTMDAGLCPDQPVTLFITEIFAPMDDEAPSWVELENTAASALRLAGVRLCQMPSCVAFGYDDTIGAQGRILVHLGRAGGDADSAQIYFPNAAPVATGGEIVLLAPGGTDVAAASGSFLSFLRYGSTIVGLTPAAVEAGLWPEIFDSARAPRVAGESLSRDRSGAQGGAAWNPTAPTPIAENPDISESTDLWQSCSFPRPWRDADPSDIVVRRISKQEPASLLVTNRGSAAVDLTTYDVAIAAASRRVSDATGLGTSTGVNDEAVVRVSDTKVNYDDFVRAAATPVSASVGTCEGLVISELVTDPVQDWSTGNYGASPGTGVVDTADEWIEIHNCGPAEADLSGYTLQLNDSTPNLIEIGVTAAGQVVVGSLLIAVGGTVIIGNPDPVAGLSNQLDARLADTSGALVDRVLLGQELSAGASMTIELRVDDSDCADQLNVCWKGAPLLPANGELSLFDAGTIVQHLRWGNAARTHTDDAVTAGVWPLSECALPELAEDGAIELSNLETGHSPPDYR